MDALNTIKKDLTHPEKILQNLGRHRLLNWLSDEAYLKVQYWLVFRKRLNLDNPTLFGEKLQWLKLHDRNTLYTTLVDKYEVKKYVANIIGEEYIIPTLGVWNSFEQIDFKSLPEQFVLKCTHDSGGLVICRDKSELDIDATKAKISRCLKQNFFYFSREWPYKNVRPRIIAEKYMEDPSIKGCTDLTDYKFYCFNGIPMFCQMITGRSIHETIDFFDMNWNRQEFTGLTISVEKSTIPPARPRQFNEMRRVVEKLAIKNPFLRVDLYDINGHVYFGEYTFYPYSGMGSFRPEKWNRILGDLIKLG